MDSPFLPFTEQLLGVGERGSRESWLCTIIRKELVEINMLLPDFAPSDSLLTDIGEYLCRATDIVAQLANRLANGNHIHTYAQLNVNQMDKQTELSELGLVDSMATKHATLKTLAEKLESANRDMSLSWREYTRGKTAPGKSTSIPLRFDTRPSIATSTVGIMAHPPGPSLHMQYSTITVEGPNRSESFVGMNESTESITESALRELKYRGKGSHYCPHGSACSKGGVTADGSLVLFERNSAFKAHLEKHLKQYKCNLPGCLNKTGFSRADLLHRHQIDVPHNAPG